MATALISEELHWIGCHHITSTSATKLTPQETQKKRIGPISSSMYWKKNQKNASYIGIKKKKVI